MVEDTRERLVKAKAKRQGVVEQRSRTGNKKKRPSRPWRVMAPAIVKGREPWCVHKALTLEAAERWIAKERRSGFWQDRPFWIERDPRLA
jgi:hypothetical protein